MSQLELLIEATVSIANQNVQSNETIQSNNNSFLRECYAVVKYMRENPVSGIKEMIDVIKKKNLKISYRKAGIDDVKFYSVLAKTACGVNFKKAFNAAYYTRISYLLFDLSMVLKNGQGIFFTSEDVVDVDSFMTKINEVGYSVIGLKIADELTEIEKKEKKLIREREKFWIYQGRAVDVIKNDVLGDVLIHAVAEYLMKLDSSNKTELDLLLRSCFFCSFMTNGIDAEMFIFKDRKDVAYFVGDNWRLYCLMHSDNNFVGANKLLIGRDQTVGKLLVNAYLSRDKMSVVNNDKGISFINKVTNNHLKFQKTLLEDTPLIRSVDEVFVEIPTVDFDVLLASKSFVVSKDNITFFDGEESLIEFPLSGELDGIGFNCLITEELRGMFRLASFTKVQQIGFIFLKDRIQVYIDDDDEILIPGFVLEIDLKYMFS